MQTKATARRRRSRAEQGGLAVVVCLLVLGGVSVANGGDSAKTVRTANGDHQPKFLGDPTTSATEVIPLAPGELPTGVVPPTMTRATSSVAPPTDPPPANDQPAPDPAPAGDPGPAATTPPPDVSSPPECTPSEVTATATADKGFYRPGEVVIVTTVLTNISSHPCVRPCGYEAVVRNSAGAGLLNSMAVCSAPLGPVPPWMPGEALTDEGSFTWAQLLSDPLSTQAPPGSYSVVISWSLGSPGTVVSSPATFELLAS
ncbi:MAG: hypothetical protein M3159_01375 [Actinomycetota bacterium]|nr:hypothetical protein [Actinomycetota bacterium]